MATFCIRDLTINLNSYIKDKAEVTISLSLNLLKYRVCSYFIALVLLFLSCFKESTQIINLSIANKIRICGKFL
jgi:hypothetical protein